MEPDTRPEKNALDAVTFLTDEPVDDDRLGSHKYVAQAIATVFTTESDGKAIALTGPWGSGKSSIAMMLEQIINEHERAESLCVVTFDAWCHEGDPLRQAFLLNLGDRLLAKGWLTKEDWIGRKEIIEKRRTEGTKTTTPLLSSAGKLLAGALLIIPLAVGLLAAFGKRGFLGWIGVILAGLYIVLVIASIIWELWDSRRQSRPFRFFLQESVVEETSSEVRTPEPTSYEFKKCFNQILGAALSPREETSQDRRLLVIIDNIDRVDTKDARAIWATMQTFFEASSHDKEDFRSHLWLLVPFDPDGVSRIWRITEEHAPGVSPQTEEEVAHSFRDKAFQVTFHISSPVLTNWREYFIKQASEALPGNASAEYHQLYSLFAARAREGEGVTPRNIVLFLNRIAALHLQCPDKEIPPVALGIYTMFEQTKLEMAKKGEPPESMGKLPDVLDVLNELIKKFSPFVANRTDCLGWLAALHYNVEVADAIQMVFEPRVMGHLQSGDSEKLAEVMREKGAAEVCESLIVAEVDSWAREEPATLIKAALALDNISIADAQIEYEIWRRLIFGFLSITEIRELGLRTGEGIGALIDHAQDSEREILLRSAVSIVRDFPSSDDPELAPLEFKNWLVETLTVIRKCSAIAREGSWRDSFYISDDKHYFYLLKSLASEKVEDEIALCFVPNEQKQEGILAELTTQISSGEFASADVQAVELMYRIKHEWSWGTLSRTLAARLANAETPLPTVAACISTLLFLAYEADPDRDVAQEELARIAKQGQLAHWLYAAEAASNVEALALAAYSMLLCVPDGQQEGVFGDSEHGIQDFRKLINEPSSFPDLPIQLGNLALKLNQVRYLLEQILPTAAGPLVFAMARDIAGTGDPTSSIPGSTLVKQYPRLRELGTAEELSSLVGSKISADMISEAMVRGFKPEYSSLYIQIVTAFTGEHVDAIDSVRQDYTDFLLAGVRAIDEPTWYSELSGPGGDILLLLAMLVDIGIAVEMELNFSDAAVRSIKDSMNASGTIAEAIQDNSGAITLAMKNGTRTGFIYKLFDIAKSEDHIISPLLTAFGSLLYDVVLMSKADEYFFELFEKIFLRNDIKGLSWILEALKNSNLWDKASANAKNHFEDRLRKNYDSPDVDEEKRNLFAQIAESCQIKLGSSNEGESAR